MLVVALALPLASLVVLGSVWLWQQGFVLYWALGATLTTLVAFAIERWLLRDAVAMASTASDPARTPDSMWHGREVTAWEDVNLIADGIDTASLDSQDAILALGTTTIEAVARRMHPGDKDPLLKFTVPEALALVERVSGELGPFVRESVPLGDRMTVGQLSAIYRWRGIVDVAEKAYDLWRIIRLMNPAAAVAQEVRENVTRQLYDWGREELARRLAKAYVREIGRAAIELYRGRRRTTTRALSEGVTDATLADLAEAGATAEPLRIVVVGEASEQHSQFVSALTRALDRPHSLGRPPGSDTRGGNGPAPARAETLLVIDATLTGTAASAPAAWTEEVREADLVVWLSSVGPSRLPDERAALQDLLQRFDRDWNARTPPLLVVAGPPADAAMVPGEGGSGAADAESDRARSIAQLAEGLGVAADQVAPLVRSAASGAFHMSPVLDHMAVAAAEARRTRVARLVRAAGRRGRLSGLWSQAKRAGSMIAGSIGRGR
mgnify:CR=1 FL=1